MNEAIIKRDKILAELDQLALNTQNKDNSIDLKNNEDAYPSAANYLSKIGSLLLNQNAHNSTISSIDSQIDIIQKQLKVISKSSVYLMTEIMYCRFRH